MIPAGFKRATFLSASPEQLRTVMNMRQLHWKRALLRWSANGIWGCRIRCLPSNRRDAIFYAVLHAQPGDTIVLCGKGHEDYQVIGHEKLHFDEREIVAEALKEREALDGKETAPWKN